MKRLGRMDVHRDVMRGEHRIVVTLTDADIVAAGGAYGAWPDIERAIDDGHRRLRKPRVNPWLARYRYRGRR